MYSDLQIAKKLVNIYKSSEKRGIECNLTLTSIRNLLSRKKCPYTLMVLTNDNYEDNSPTQSHLTIDRIDNNKGYVQGNVIACSRYANQLKGSMSVEFIHNMYKVINKHGD